MLSHTITQAQASRKFAHIPDPVLSALIRQRVATKRAQTAAFEQLDADLEVHQRKVDSGTSDEDIVKYGEHVHQFVEECRRSWNAYSVRGPYTEDIVVSQGRDSVLSMLSISSTSSIAAASTVSRTSLMSDLTQYSDSSNRQSVAHLAHGGELASSTSTMSPVEVKKEKPLPPDPPTVSSADIVLHYKCSCGVTCARRTDFWKHVKNLHARSILYKCRLCGREERTKTDIKSHCQVHEAYASSKPTYDEYPIPKDDFLLTCIRHQMYFASLKDFVNHYATEAEIDLCQAVLLQPHVQHALGRSFRSKFSTQPTDQAIRRLTWPAQEAQSIASKLQKEKCHLNVLERLLNAATFSETTVMHNSQQGSDDATVGNTQNTLVPHYPANTAFAVPKAVPKSQGAKRQPSTDASHHPEAPPLFHARLEPALHGSPPTTVRQSYNAPSEPYTAAPMQHAMRQWKEALPVSTAAGMQSVAQNAFITSTFSHEKIGPDPVRTAQSTQNAVYGDNPDAGHHVDNGHSAGAEPLHHTESSPIDPDTTMSLDGNMDWNGYVYVFDDVFGETGPQADMPSL